MAKKKFVTYEKYFNDMYIKLNRSLDDIRNKYAELNRKNNELINENVQLREENIQVKEERDKLLELCGLSKEEVKDVINHTKLLNQVTAIISSWNTHI